MLTNELFVEISPNNRYPIFINSDPIEKLEKMIFNFTDANKILIVISETVNKLYGKKLSFKNSIKFVLKDGENQKNFKNYIKILNFALKNKLERKDAFVAIGGGVVGDITGFAAATYLRGIDFIQIPTTLLACVDSSVGGKVAVNSEFGKNMIGSFYQPKAVFCNLNFLDSLDDRQFKTGLAEVVKYAFIEKSCQSNIEYNFFQFLEDNCANVLSRDSEVLSKIICISLQLKASVVAKDEKELGLRKILNFGHTLGHAVERITNYKKYTHGEAIAIGMIFSINLAFKKLLLGDSSSNTSGVLTKLQTIVTNATDPTNGYFVQRNSSFVSDAKALNSQISDMNTALTQYQSQLEAKFQAMDTLISNLRNSASVFDSYFNTSSSSSSSTSL